MKKAVAAALAAAFVIGTGATTFAATSPFSNAPLANSPFRDVSSTNPFSDVPRTHWAYKSIQYLKDLGILEGYANPVTGEANNEFKRRDRYGNVIPDEQQYITRYEMAQMVAKALARFEEVYADGAANYDADSSRGMRSQSEPSNSQSALNFRGDLNTYRAARVELDRLSAEFGSELDRLGVRVAELEKHADKVTWTGELRYRYWKDDTKLKGGGKSKPSNNQLQLRLFPTAEVNDHWKLKARMTATSKMHDDTSGDFNLTYAFAEGKYNNFTINVGKMPFYTYVDDGMLVDDFFSGANVTFGKKVKVALSAGRWGGTDDPASYQGGEVSYDNDKLYVGAGYHHFNSDDFKAAYGEDDANVWAVGARYKLNEDMTLGGAFAKNTKADDFDKSYNIALDYKGASRKEPGSWGLGVAYRYIGENTSLAPTYDVWFRTDNKKGVDVYGSWSPLKNTYTQLNYFWGKTLDTHKDTKTFFGRLSWFF